MQAPSGVVYRSWSPGPDEFGNRDLAADLPAARGGRPGGCDVIARHDPSARPITVLLDPAAVRRGHLELARQLGMPGRLCSGRAPAQPLPSALALLIWFECHVLGAAGGAIDPVEDLTFDVLGEPEAGDVVIDLAGRAAPQPGGRTLRVLFDGIPGECGLFAAIMRGAAPNIEIEEVERGVVVASGTPATDNAGAVSEAYEFIWARVVTLLHKALSVDGGVAPVWRVEASPFSTAEIITRQVKLIGCDAVRRLYRMCCYAPHWRTMWRRRDGAASPTPSLAGGAWQVLPDPGVRFFADPFPIVHDGRVFLFVEDLDHRTQKAVISVVAFDQNGPVGEARPVLGALAPVVPVRVCP